MLERLLQYDADIKAYYGPKDSKPIKMSLFALALDSPNFMDTLNLIFQYRPDHINDRCGLCLETAIRHDDDRALDYAAFKGNLTMFKTLLQYKADPFSPRQSHHPSLLVSAVQNETQDTRELINYTIELGFSPHGFLDDPFCEALSRGNLAAVKCLHLEHNTSFQFRQATGMNPLHYAIHPDVKNSALIDWVLAQDGLELNLPDPPRRF